MSPTKNDNKPTTATTRITLVFLEAPSRRLSRVGVRVKPASTRNVSGRRIWQDLPAGIGDFLGGWVDEVDDFGWFYNGFYRGFGCFVVGLMVIFTMECVFVVVLHS